MNADVVTFAITQRRHRRPPITLGGLGDWEGDVYFPDESDLRPADYVTPIQTVETTPVPGFDFLNPHPQPITINYSRPGGGEMSSGPSNLDSILKAIETGLVAFAKPGNAYAASTALRPTSNYTPQGQQVYTDAQGRQVDQYGKPFGVGQDTGRAVGSIFDSFTLLVKQHPLAFLLGGGGLALYVLNPPKWARRS